MINERSRFHFIPSSDKALFVYANDTTYAGFTCTVSISTPTETLDTLDGVTCVNICRKLPFTKLIPS